ncbi:hypothetical protein ABTI15_20405, partial [Acinetobacter baumannii]
DVLNDKFVRRRPVTLDQAFEPDLSDGTPSGLEVLPFIVPGKRAWYLEGRSPPGGSDGVGDTMGLRVADSASGKHFFFLAA